MKVRRLHCPVCKTKTRCTSQGANHVLHALLSLFTLSLWLIVWAWVSFRTGKNWSCDVCGSSVSLPGHPRLALVIALPFALLGVLMILEAASQ